VNKSKSLPVTRLLVLAFAISIFALPGTVFGQSFQGSEYCQNCHEKEFNEWSASGHPYKLMRGEDAKHRAIPLPGGYKWADISWVIGGYKWKSRYMDTDGYIITVTDDDNGVERDGVNQYNYLTGEWSSYHGGEVDVPYTCGSCHTTNWVANPDPTDLSGNKDSLPGIHGTFDEGGVHCEQCHGNNGGEGHMTGIERIDTSAEACGICHWREAAPGAATNVIPASGGFIKHHEQYNEFLASPHSGGACVDCHDPHKRGEYSIKEGKECSNCHVAQAASYAENSMADYNVTCEDCHMSYATKSAQPLGTHQGDVQTHIFRIDTDPEANMFTPEGDYVALDGEGQAAVTLDFACQRCHETAELPELARFAKNFHGTEKDESDVLLSELHYAGINPGLTGNWWGGSSRDGEGFLLDVSYSNGALVVVVSFYTYDLEGNQLWLIGAGVVAENSDVVSVNLKFPEGAKWGPDFNPADLPSPRTKFGKGEFMFSTCGTATFFITPNAEMAALGYVGHGYDLTRDVTTSAIACPTMLNNAAILD